MPLTIRIAAPVLLAASALGITQGCGSASKEHLGSYRGLVGIGQISGSNGEYAHTAGAVFGVSTEPPGCTVTTHGACTVLACIAATGPDGGGTVDPDPDAGVLTFTGGMLQPPATLTPDPATGMYPQLTAAGQIFAAGDAVTVSAAGGDVPAFTATATVPTDVSVTSPPLGTTSTSIASGQPLTFTWTGGTSGDVTIELAWNPTNTSSQGVLCTFAASGGIGTVPSGELPAVGASGNIVVQSRIEIDTTAGAYSIQYTVGANQVFGRFDVQ